jgi:hypothetical protein
MIETMTEQQKKAALESVKLSLMLAWTADTLEKKKAKR